MALTFELGRKFIRPYRTDDEHDVLALINEDRLTGQPFCTWNMLEAARVGRSAAETAGWARLVPVRTDVVVDEEDVVLGVVSTAVRRPDGAGVLLWLHAGEEPAVVHPLLDAVIGRLAGRAIEAFPLLNPLGFGLRGVPREHRPVTFSALRSRSFEATSSSVYLHRHLAPSAFSRPAGRIGLAQRTGSRSWRIHEPGSEAHLDVTVSPDDTGWIAYGGPGGACAEAAELVPAAIRLLGLHAARNVVATAPAAGPEARSMREALWDLGFTEVDRLEVLRRPAPAARTPAGGAVRRDASARSSVTHA
ncbi:hypothetical protein [Actinomadura macrotermitis]|uniref:N-acetyltransferase domain-containing protein n=1 Tax=Actinomadura macrotermitis TaxID=2585200 RepID=A0A7K0BLP6_9ACTN|nr:hypothetical protein [Actinomadura macrotermitis]MQY02108.1 hypothetical protein [Actinomadura macrotermitis]